MIKINTSVGLVGFCYRTCGLIWVLRSLV